MIIKNIKLYNFRNYKNLEINLNSKTNIFCGNNGQGKTNFLESIYFLSITKSHRSFLDKYIIKENEKECSIIGTIQRKENIDKYKIILSNQKKQLFINNNQIKSVSEYISKINIIIFYPEDLEIIKGSPENRRRFLNIELGQINSIYLNLLSDYNNILKQRNMILKNLKINNIDRNYLEIITKLLVEKGSLIIYERGKFVDELSKKASIVFNDISDIKDFQVKYINSLNVKTNDLSIIKKEFETKLLALSKQEEKYGITLVGPHKDDLEFITSLGNLKNFGSQGQQRIGILSLKMAEIQLLYEATKEYPILLLDDVFSELDLSKRINLLNYLNDNVQTIITTTELDNIPSSILKDATIFKLENQNIIEINEVK